MILGALRIVSEFYKGLEKIIKVLQGFYVGSIHHRAEGFDPVVYHLT